MAPKPVSLKMLPRDRYQGVNQYDPIRYYYWPVIGSLYRRRVELALAECAGGDRVLEIGFGTGLAFPSLHNLYKEIHGLDLTADIQAVESVYRPIGIALDLRAGDVLQMPYPDNHFDTVLLISILEHLNPAELGQAFLEVRRVLKPGGQMVYGTPVERPFMVAMFRLLGHNIRNEHFSTERQIASAAENVFTRKSVIQMNGAPFLIGPLYEVGHFVKGTAR